MQMQYDPVLLHSQAIKFERNQLMETPLRLPSYHPEWSRGVLHPVKNPQYLPPRCLLSAMLKVGNLPGSQPIIRNALQMTTTGLLDVIYDTGAVMSMVTDHGTGYMTNKRETSHQITGCLNETPKGGLHIADFNFLLRMDDTTEGHNGWFHIVAPQT